MSTEELYDRIHSWLWLYEHSPFPASDDPEVIHISAVVGSKWAEEMLSNIASINIPESIQGTPVEHDLCQAIEYAKSNNHALVIDIYYLLIKVTNFIIGHPQTGRIISRN